MRTRLLGFTASLLVVGSALAPALAQPSKGPDVQKMAKDDCAKARAAGKTCVLDITDGDIHEGEVPKGEGTGFTGIGFGKATSLIRIRRDFIQQIMKSAEDL